MAIRLNTHSPLTLRGLTPPLGLALYRFDFVTEPSTQGAFLVPSTRKYRKLPDQTLAVELAHTAGKALTVSGQPMEEAILPMDNHVKPALQLLHRKLDPTQMQSINTTFDSGPHNIEESQQLGSEQIDETHATLPPHPTKLPAAAPPRPQVPASSSAIASQPLSPAWPLNSSAQPGSVSAAPSLNSAAPSDAGSFQLPNMVQAAAN